MPFRSLDLCSTVRAGQTPHCHTVWLDGPVWRLSRIQIRRAPRPRPRLRTQIVPQDSTRAASDGYHRFMAPPRAGVLRAYSCYPSGRAPSRGRHGARPAPSPGSSASSMTRSISSKLKPTSCSSPSISLQISVVCDPCLWYIVCLFLAGADRGERELTAAAAGGGVAVGRRLGSCAYTRILLNSAVV
jgi:hypothetical protein